MLDKETMTKTEVNEWLSRCFVDCVKDEENFHDQLCATVEALYMQGALSSPILEKVIYRIQEQAALIATIPKPVGWRIRMRRPNGESCPATTFPEQFPSYESACIHAFNTIQGNEIEGDGNNYVVMPVFQLYGDDKFAIVMANNGLQELERRFSVTQKEVVDGLIESSCCSEIPTLTKYIGYKGTQQERLNALRQALK